MPKEVKIELDSPLMGRIERIASLSKQEMFHQLHRNEPDFVLVAILARLLDEIGTRKAIQAAAQQAWDPSSAPSFAVTQTIPVPVIRPAIRPEHPRTAENVSHAPQACRRCGGVIRWEIGSVGTPAVLGTAGWRHLSPNLDDDHQAEPQP